MMTSRNTMMIVGALVVLIALSAVNLFLLLGNNNAGQQPAEQPEVLAPQSDPIFVKVGPLTVNLESSRYGERLLYTTLSLRVENEETHELINKYMPEVQNRLLMLLSAHTAEQLTTAEGKQYLAREVRKALEPPLVEHQPPLAISAVLFTDFIVQ